MRKLLSALALSLTLVPSFVHADDKLMPADVGVGRVAWFDITTTEQGRSKEFYGKLFDWQFGKVTGSDQAAEIIASGAHIGTLRVADGKLSPFTGMVYVQVADLPASCKRAKELGGMIPPGFPFNLPGGIGAIAVVSDPVGHPIGMYSRTPLPQKPSTSPAK